MFLAFIRNITLKTLNSIFSQDNNTNLNMDKRMQKRRKRQKKRSAQKKKAAQKKMAQKKAASRRSAQKRRTSRRRRWQKRCSFNIIFCFVSAPFYFCFYQNTAYTSNVSYCFVQLHLRFVYDKLFFFLKIKQFGFTDTIKLKSVWIYVSAKNY